LRRMAAFTKRRLENSRAFIKTTKVPTRQRQGISVTIEEFFAAIKALGLTQSSAPNIYLD